MSLKINQDHSRFRAIVRGKVRDNLKRFIASGELIGRQGGERVSIPLPQIDIPRFVFGERQGGAGQGEGEPGDPLPGQGGEGQGKEQAGQGAGEHALEVELSVDELAEILGEELELPTIEPRGRAQVQSARDKYQGIARVGPESLKHFRRTFREALKRQIAAGSYQPDRPIIVPTRDDRRYRSWDTQEEPLSNAVIIYMMDVSGSMGDEQKEIVRAESFWIDAWLRKQYKGIESRYIIHDATAKEVDRETFFRTRESGGTMISSAYKLCAKLIAEEYPASEWNIYPFHFSDGDNWSADDTKESLQVLRDQILPSANQFSYGQVVSPYGSGQFLKDLRGTFAQEERVVLSEIRDRDGIMESIREFLRRGR